MASLVKVGGLADVIEGLTRALAERKHDVRVVVPLYGCISRPEHKLESTGIHYTVSVKGEEEPARIWTTKTAGGVRIYLIENASFFGGPEVYTPEDLDRFFYFSKASLELLRYLDWQPDVLHCHDWHTAAIISLIKNELRQTPGYSSLPTVFTIHNLGYQGWFDYAWATASGLVSHIPGKEDPLHPLLWRMIALGIHHSDVVSTVSETYAKEILTPEYGEGLDMVLRHREERLYGIVNGIDYDDFNPATDPYLPVNYDFTSISKKQEVKRALQMEVGLSSRPGVPLLGYVGRFTRQKGTPILVEGVEGILAKHEAQLVALGQAPKGEEKYEEVLRTLEARHPQQVKVLARFDDPLAHRIYAGCDLFLMPSLYEPCGLGQLISFRYGTVPVVRHTGGLADTVVEHPVMGNGFVFHDTKDGTDLTNALERAICLFQRQERWEQMVVRAMNSDVSWERACQKYEELYRRAMWP